MDKLAEAARAVLDKWEDATGILKKNFVLVRKVHIDTLRAALEEREPEYVCVHGHDRCAQMYPGPDCPYCEKRPSIAGGAAPEMVDYVPFVILKWNGRYVGVRGLRPGGKDHPGEITDMENLIADLQAAQSALGRLG